MLCNDKRNSECLFLHCFVLVDVRSAIDNCYELDAVTVSDRPFVEEVLSQFGTLFLLCLYRRPLYY